MKKISLFILSVLLPLLSSAANSTLSIEPLTIGAGETKTMLIDLSNPDQQVTMVEFRMQLPQGLSIAAGDNAFDIAGRTNWQKHTLYSNEKDGLIHVMLASPTNALVSGTSGALISVRLTASSTFSGGTITLKNQKIGSPDMTVSKPADYSYTVQTPSAEAEPYVVYNNGTLTFYYDNQRSSRAGTTYDLNTGENKPSWYDNRKSIAKVVFDNSFAGARPKTTYCWFLGCMNLTEIQGTSHLNTSEVTNMRYMFRRCSGLTSLDVSSLKTDNVTYMSGMFGNCSSLTNLDVSGFKTDNVTNMDNMFESCSSLTSLNISGFKTDNVTNMSRMFSGCSSLTNLDVSGFNTDNVTNMSSMFYDCSSLTNLDVSSFKADKVTDMPSMFRDCSSLTNLNISGFMTDNVTDMCYIFSGCSSLTNLDVSGFKTDNVTNMSHMFSDCSSLTNLNVSGFKTDNVTNMSDMFQSCSSLTNLDVSGFKTDNVTNMSGMFCNCSSLTNLDVSGFKTANVTNMWSIFEDCNNLHKLTLGNKFVTKETTECTDAFADCTSLNTISFTGDIPATINSKFFERVGTAAAPATLDVPAEYRDHYAAKFDGNKFFGGYFKLSGGEEPGTDIISFADLAVKQICVSNWDTNGDGELSKAEAAAVKEIGTVFQNNKDVTSFDEFQYFTGIETIQGYTFFDCTNLKSIKLPNSVSEMKYNAIYRCSKISSISFPDNDEFILKSGAITYCNSLKTVFLPKNTKILDGNPFSGCTSLTSIEVDENSINYKSVNGVVYTKHGYRDGIIAYPSGKKQTEYEVLSGTAYIHNNAFNESSNLQKIILPSSLEEIHLEAFYNCGNLITINIPNSVKTIDDFAFCFCYQLTSINLPNSLTHLGTSVFLLCI